MRRAVLLLLAAAACVVLAPPARARARAKATIDGPWALRRPVHLRAKSRRSGSLGEVDRAFGFFPAVFQTVPDPMLQQRPAGELGPRYVVTYVVPGPNSERDVLEQHLYPYATPRTGLVHASRASGLRDREDAWGLVRRRSRR